MRALKRAMRPVSRVAPGLAAGIAERLWFTPPPQRLSVPSRNVLREARAFAVPWQGRPLACWQWGHGPAVHLMHGWGGNAGDLSRFVAPLVHRGFRVIAFDAPAHGQSAAAWSWAQTDGFEFADALCEVVNQTGPSVAVIAHSLGAVAASVALANGLRVNGVVFLAAMADPAAYLDTFAAALGLSEHAANAMTDRIGRRINFRWGELKVAGLADRVAVPPALIVHDLADPEAPWAGAAEIAKAWPRAELVTTSGLGHRRLLKDPAALNRVADFIATVSGPSPLKTS